MCSGGGGGSVRVSSTTSSRFKVFMIFTAAKMTTAIIKKSTTVWIKAPYFSNTASCPSLAFCTVRVRSEKCTPPSNTPMGGIITYATNEETILLKVDRMMPATALTDNMSRMYKEM